ncbi:MAG: Flp pilus assembly complex ATPase component TadA [Candidatus Aenigmarchaeota archaeon]|nr:Flp pilus assembly complex ATPase component TadA [Candidatus Aenigmarchaeota archaeon]
MKLNVKKNAAGKPLAIGPIRFKINPRFLALRFRKGYFLLMERRRRAMTEQMKAIGIPPSEQMYYQQFFMGGMGGGPGGRGGQGGAGGQGGGPGGGGAGDSSGGSQAAEVEKKIVQVVEIEGFNLPTEEGYESKINIIPGRKEALAGVNISYPLIPKNPKRGEEIFASVNIRWDRTTGEVIYNVIQPPLSDEDRAIVEKVKRDLEERLDIDFIKLGPIKAKNMLVDEISQALVKYKTITPERKTLIIFYIERDVIGYGKLEAIMNDPNIEDISCDGIRIPLFVYHRDPKLGSLKTNVWFDTAEELNLFVSRLAQKCKKTISIAEPLLDATLPDGSRVQATLGTDIARKGSNYTIRKFTELPLTPTHMLKYGTLNSMQLAYLWLAIENGMSVLVSGGTATGKTSLMNSLSLFIRPNLKVVSIEDTAELRLPHPHWIPHVARTAIGSGVSKKGEVTLFDLLRSSLRQRPDYIIVGEVRGKEAFVLFQQMASIPGEEKVMIMNGSNLERLPIGSIQNGKSYRIPTIDPDTLKMTFLPLKMNVEHPATAELFKITTETGREITAKGSHSLFTLRDGEIEPVIISESKPGDEILIPATMPSGYNDINELNLLELLPDIRVYSPSCIKQASRKLGFEKASKIAGFATISNYYGVNNCALPAGKFKMLMEEAKLDYDTKQVNVRFGRRSSVRPAAFEITPEFLRLLGYHISEGSINIAHKNNSMAMYNKDEKVLMDMRHCIMAVTGKKPKERITAGFGTATELRFSDKTLFEIFRRFCKAKSDIKQVPGFIFGLSKERIGHFLSGLYAGDSSVEEKKIVYYTTSRQLAEDVSTLLLAYGIVARMRNRKRAGRKTTDYEIAIYREDDRKEFALYVRPVGKEVRIKGTGKGADRRKTGDVYLDRIQSIEKITLEKPVPVFDLSVPPTQNFIGGFGGVLLHNTGHPSLATIHAATFQQLIDRLITPPISLPPTLIENVNIIVFLVLARVKGRYLRRADAVMEVVGIQGDKPLTRKVFEWKPGQDSYEIAEKSVILESIAKRQGMTEDSIKEEIVRRRRILEWMVEQNITDYRDVARVISTYYSNPQKIVSIVTGGKVEPDED